MSHALAGLAQQSRLVADSGKITHNLRDWQLVSRGAALKNI
jgi:hypothetical protein